MQGDLTSSLPKFYAISLMYVCFPKESPPISLHPKIRSPTSIDASTCIKADGGVEFVSSRLRLSMRRTSRDILVSHKIAANVRES